MLNRIDQLTAPDHSFIDADSNCYYFGEYPRGIASDNSSNPMYSLIHNLKKTCDRRVRPEWQYKLRAIDICARYIINFFNSVQDLQNYTLIPIPPSKTRDDELYDSRMHDILLKVQEAQPLLDVKDVLYTQQELNSHNNSIRPSIQELQSNYRVDESLIIDIRQKIVLFDDVLTTGAHFCAAKNKLVEFIGMRDYKGVFIARRVLPIQDDIPLLDILLR
jgi:predicted amidophosphoribosyltransferase